MSNVCIKFDPTDVKLENREQVCTAVCLLIRLTGDRPNCLRPTSIAAELDAPPVKDLLVDSAKPKRKRRTKAQIAADKVAAEEAVAEAVVVEAHTDTQLEVDPLADAPDPVTVATEQDVRAAVVEAITRLTKGGTSIEDSTATIVEKLVEFTGKERVSAIDPGLYRTVIGGLSEV